MRRQRAQVLREKRLAEESLRRQSDAIGTLQLTREQLPSRQHWYDALTEVLKEPPFCDWPMEAIEHEYRLIEKAYATEFDGAFRDSIVYREPLTNVTASADVANISDIDPVLSLNVNDFVLEVDGETLHAEAAQIVAVRDVMDVTS